MTRPILPLASTSGVSPAVVIPEPFRLAAARIHASVLVGPRSSGLGGTMVGLGIVAAAAFVFSPNNESSVATKGNGAAEEWSGAPDDEDGKSPPRWLPAPFRYIASSSVAAAAFRRMAALFLRRLASALPEELVWRAALLPHPNADGAGSFPPSASQIALVSAAFAMCRPLLAHAAYPASGERRRPAPAGSDRRSFLRPAAMSLAMGVGCAAAYVISDGALYSPLLVRAIVPAALCGGALGDRTLDAPRLGGGRRAPLSEEERWVDRSIAASMPPAANLGIRIEALDLADGSLSLAMPLRGNTNVHGTAFAGSLYSVAGLCAWYALVCYFRSEGLDKRYTVVMKSASIAYRRPVRSRWIVARSVLPTVEERTKFLDTLERDGKAYLDVSGSIMQGEKAAVEYTAHLCAFQAQRGKMKDT